MISKVLRPKQSLANLLRHLLHRLHGLLLEVVRVAEQAEQVLVRAAALDRLLNFDHRELLVLVAPHVLPHRSQASALTLACLPGI